MTLSNVINPQTQAALFALLMAGHLSNGVPTASWTSPRNPYLSLTQYAAQLFAVLYAILASAIRGCFLDYASGAPLTLFAKSQYQLDRIPSQFTAGKMMLRAVATAPANTFAPGDITVGTPGPQTTASRYFTNITGGTLNAGGTLTLDFQATEPGTAWNIPPGSSLELKTSFAGVAVTNPVYASGTWITSQGADQESDDRLKLRCLSRWGTLGVGGNEDAFRFWAMQIPDGYTSSPVSQVAVLANYYNGAAAPGAATVAIVGPAGALGGGDVAAVQRNFDQPITSLVGPIPGLGELGKKYPIGCQVQVVSAANYNVTLTGTVSVLRRANVTLSQVQVAVTAALTAYQRTLLMGQTIHVRGKVEGVISQATPYQDAIASVDLSTMSDPINLSILQYPVLVDSLTYQLVDG